MNLPPNYDPALQMFTRPPADPDPKKLVFLRALAEFGLLETQSLGDPSGPFVEAHGTSILKPLIIARLGVAAYALPMALDLRSLADQN